MTAENGIQVYRRVAIAMDALSPSQKAALKPMLQSRDQFLAYAKKPGMTRKVSASKPLYAMKAGSGMRHVFEAREGDIVVRDLMQEVTMHRYLKRKVKTSIGKKARAAMKRPGIKVSKS